MQLWEALRGLLGLLNPFARRPTDPRAALLRVCHGDQERARRLIEYELERAPGLTEEHACVRALERWRRDQ